MGSSSARTDDGAMRQHLLGVGVGVDVDGLAGAGPKIRVRGLTLRPPGPNGEPTVAGSDLDVPRGVVMGVIGPSGSGKSTLLRALNRLWEPAPGAVALDGADIRGLDVLALRRRVGMLFQLPAMFHGTVADNVRYGPRLRGETLSDAQVKELLSMSDLDHGLASRPASELSVGQAQRVALARTLANGPEVLLLDEPTSALDPISTQNIEEAIVRLKKERGLTTVIVSHSVRQIQRIADLVCLVVDGVVVEVLPPSDLSQAKHPMARRFLELS
ncbi:protein STAR1-like isoform X2 [Hordeum vulgare subsp. vulgare]|uniref:protein STAR1-like isoform X2 n=1 Tax=Hordeum vulgare subsp. vulgare TaxID=112509 RepID=UPI000B479958|nr:protein STAR1-like isoform X2 [Hordeum vulgare subsp. vulgare]